MKTILAFFGYVQVPKAAVELSMMTEDALKAVRKLLLPEASAYLDKALEGAETLTEFLRSGRLINRSP